MKQRDKWLNEIISTLLDRIKSPNWFDRSIDRPERKVSLVISGQTNTNTITPVDVSNWVFRELVEIIEMNELSVSEIEQVVKTVAREIPQIIESHIETIYRTLENPRNDWDFVHAYSNMKTVPFALKRFETLLIAKLTKYSSSNNRHAPDEVTPDTEPKDLHPKIHYFTTPEAYEVFKFLADEYRNDDYVKWSVIREFMKNNGIETHLSGRKYLQWIIDHYEPEMKSINLQPTTDEAHEIITTVFSRYKTPT